MIEFLLQELTLQEAETIALSILKQVMEEKVKASQSSLMFVISVTKNPAKCLELNCYLEQVTPNNVDIAKVAPNYHLYTPAEVEAVIARL
jgi:20S proteasome subunit alpha 5